MLRGCGERLGTHEAATENWRALVTFTAFMVTAGSNHGRAQTSSETVQHVRPRGELATRRSQTLSDSIFAVQSDVPGVPAMALRDDTTVALAATLATREEEATMEAMVSVCGCVCNGRSP